MNKNSKLIPVCEPCFLGNEISYVRNAVRSRRISSSGTYLKKFEENFSTVCDTRFGIAVSSGTTALHVALRVLDVKEGDEVIIPDFTMAAVLFAVLYCGAKPVFIDAEKETWNIDPKKIKNKISRRTKAIIVVHTFGHPCNMTPILKLARKNKITVVEDAAEAHGALYLGEPCGSFGALSCFSFYGNKIITTGEGGMVVTSDRQLADRCRYFRNMCFRTDGVRDYTHNDLGFNYRMTNIQAALGLAQLEKMDQLVKRRRNNACLYHKYLCGVKGLTLPVEKKYAKNVYWMYGIVVNSAQFGCARDRLKEELAKAGIETRVFFSPLHRQGVLKNNGHKSKGSYPVSEWLSENGLYLPSGSGLSSGQIKRVCDTIKNIQKAHLSTHGP